MSTDKRSFGSIEKLPSGRYRAKYRGPDLQRHSAPRSFDARIDAEAWLADERRRINWGEWTSPAERKAAAAQRDAQRKALGFDVYARAWLAGRHDLRPTTRVTYTCSIERHLIPFFGSTPIDEIDADSVRSWFTSYGVRTPTARAHAFAVLRSIFKQAEDDELIVRNPARIKSGGRAEPQRDPQVLTLPELFALTKVMPERHRALTLLSGFCGLRFGEAVALRRSDVDLAEGVVNITHGMTRVNGEKAIGKPKTKAAVRTVAMPDVVTEALRAHMAKYTSGGRHALVFPGKDGQPLAPSALYGRAARTERRARRTFEKAAYGFFAAREAIGRPELHWHDLRRTAATLGAQSGATVREMQHRLGHTTPAMALHYQGATQARDRAIADQLDLMAKDAGSRTT